MKRSVLLIIHHSSLPRSSFPCPSAQEARERVDEGRVPVYRDLVDAIVLRRVNPVRRAGPSAADEVAGPRAFAVRAHGGAVVRVTRRVCSDARDKGAAGVVAPEEA